MTDWVTFRDTRGRLRGLSAALRAVLDAQPGCTTADIERALPRYSRRSILRQLARWRAVGAVHAEIAGASAPYHRTLRWRATPALQAIRSGGSRAHPPVPMDETDDEREWTPPTNYISASRRIILGLPLARRAA